jgi:protein KRI1
MNELDASDSEDTDEDEYGQDLTPEIDAQIFRTIAAIRQRDQRVYDTKTNFLDGSYCAPLIFQLIS